MLRSGASCSRAVCARPKRVALSHSVLQQNASSVFGEDVPICGTPLYADARLYAEHGVAAVLYGAGPRTLLESNAKRADEHVVLERFARRHQGHRPQSDRAAAKPA